MSLFLDRSKRFDPHLEWKVRIFAVAAVTGLGGIYFDERWMGVLAIVLLAFAMFLRLFLPRPGPEREDEDDGSDRGEPEDGDATV